MTVTGQDAENTMRDEHSNINHALAGIFIPPCPESLTSIMRKAKNPNADVSSIAQLISRDAGLAGPMLKLANSPLIGLRTKATSVLQAVSVLGMQKTLSLVQNIALQKSLSGDAHDFEKFWERSSLTATIAEKLAIKFPTVSRNDAYIAALFHDSGIPVLMMKFREYRETMMAHCKPGRSICDIENQIFFTSHPVVGNMLTRNWNLPAHISKAILYHHDSTIYGSMVEKSEVYDLISILHMAECVTDEHLHVNDKEWPQFEQDVLNYFEISEQEFSEIKGDILAVLNGD